MPVSDVDRALTFYTDRAGFSLDIDYHPSDDFRLAQLTPPGSSCSKHWRGGFEPGLEPDRRDYASFADFTDPDGDRWVLQERGFHS